MKRRFKVFMGIQQLIMALLYLCLVISLAALVFYLLEVDYNDAFLFFLLIILRYSSFLLCICSLYKIIVNIFHIIRRPRILRIMKTLLYLLFIVYGMSMVFLESFIVVISGGIN